MIIDDLLLSTLPSDRMYEFNLNWILKKIKELLTDFKNLDKKFDTLEEQFNALLEYVNEYFENLDLTDVITEILHEMYEDGSLERIIDSMNTFVETIDTIPDGAIYSHGYSPQSMAINDNYLYMAFTDGSDHGSIEKYDIISGDKINSTVDVGYGHQNGMCIHDNRLLIAQGGGANNRVAITVHDLDSLAIINDITLNIQGSIWALASSGNNLYGLHGNNICELSLNTETGDFSIIREKALRVYSDNPLLKTRTAQDMFYAHGYLWVIDNFLTGGNDFSGIAYFSAYNPYNLEFVRTVKCYTSAEVESAHVYGKYLYYVFNSAGYGVVCKGSLLTTPENIGVGALYDAMYTTKGYSGSVSDYDIYTHSKDTDNSNYKALGTYEFPFKCIWHWGHISKNWRITSQINLYCDGDLPQTFVITNVDYHLAIIGNPVTRFNRCVFRDSPYLSLQNVEINGVNQNNALLELRNITFFYSNNVILSGSAPQAILQRGGECLHERMTLNGTFDTRLLSCSNTTFNSSQNISQGDVQGENIKGLYPNTSAFKTSGGKCNFILANIFDGSIFDLKMAGTYRVEGNPNNAQLQNMPISTFNNSDRILIEVHNFDEFWIWYFFVNTRVFVCNSRVGTWVELTTAPVQ